MTDVKKRLVDLVQAVNGENNDLDALRTEIEIIRLDRESLTDEEKNQFRVCLKKYRQLQRDALFQRECTDKPLTTSSELIDHGQNVLKQSIEAEQRMVSLVEDTKEIARTVMVKIDTQTETIQKHNDDLNGLDDSLSRSLKIIGKMLKRTAGSKVIWMLSFLLIIMIVVVIVLSVKS